MTQIFLSYARDDDLLPPNLPSGRQVSGFVTALHNQLQYEFRDLGGERPGLWRDVHGIERGDQFAEVIESQINRSDLLLVILSLNWIKRDWCLRELEAFHRRWGEEARQRIVIASKRPVPLDLRPSLLRGQEGYDFFYLEPGSQPGQEIQYFDRGQILDDRYYDQVTDLARFLASHQQRRGRAGQAAPLPAVAAPAPSMSPAGGRTVYVAKPAADMRPAYGRIVEELGGRGFRVTPPSSSDIPNNHTATDMIDAALKEADLSVHLLGEKMGYAPEDADPIARLQLARAALHATASSPASFHRIVWAPRVLAEDESGAVERDTPQVLNRFDRHLPGDKLVGDNLSKFVDFLLQRLDDLAAAQAPQTLSTGEEMEGAVYVYHRPEDQDYALQLAKLLQNERIEPRLPALEGDPAELSALHREELQNCTSVVLCWANASEVWVKATARELAKWRELGRREKFACRAVVALPPPGLRKTALTSFPPRSEIDVVLDLTAAENVDANALVPVIQASRAS